MDTLDLAQRQQPQALAIPVLTVDVGGSHIKVRSSAGGGKRKVASGPDMSAERMAAAVRDMADGLEYDAITIGYPGPVMRNRIQSEPHNLGPGWRSFDFAAAFDVPIRIVNDALMQAIGSYSGGRMMFLGLGTGLGSALIVENVCVPMEIAHMPYRKKRSYEDYLGKAGLEKRGHRKWRKHVARVCGILDDAVRPEYIVIGGGNVDELDALPPKAIRGDNKKAFEGGFRVWTDPRLVLS